MSSSSQDLPLCELYNHIHTPDIADRTAVCLRGENHRFRVYPDVRSSFGPAICALNAAVAVKSRTAAVQTVLTETIGIHDVRIRHLDRLPIIDSFMMLPHYDTPERAALVREGAVLVVWAETIEAVVASYRDLEHRLQHLARHCYCNAYPDITSLDDSPRGNNVQLDSCLFGDNRTKSTSQSSSSAYGWNSHPPSVLPQLEELEDIQFVDPFPDELLVDPYDHYLNGTFSNGLPASGNDVPVYGTQSDYFDVDPNFVGSSPFADISPSSTVYGPSSAGSTPSTYSPLVSVSPSSTVSPWSGSPETLSSPHTVDPLKTISPQLAISPILTVGPVSAIGSSDGVENNSPADPDVAHVHERHTAVFPWSDRPIAPLPTRKRGRPKGSGLVPPIPALRTLKPAQHSLHPLPGRPTASSRRRSPSTASSAPPSSHTIACASSSISRTVGQKSKRSQQSADDDEDSEEVVEDDASVYTEDDCMDRDDEDDEYTVSPPPAKRAKSSSTSSKAAPKGKPRRGRRRASTAVKKARFHCDACNVWIARKTDFNRHLGFSKCKALPEEVKIRSQCRFCDHSFNRLDALFRHERTKHRDVY